LGRIASVLFPTPGLAGHGTAIWAQHRFTDGAGITGCPAFAGHDNETR
jgi:hypothetical protein